MDNMEDLLRRAFQYGQQWVKDLEDGNEPISFNEWIAQLEIQTEASSFINREKVSDRCTQMLVEAGRTYGQAEAIIAYWFPELKGGQDDTP